MSDALVSLQTQRIAAGLSITELARKANVSEWLIRQLEVGGTCTGDEAQRLADALAVSLATLGPADR